ncbi:glycoside hydrolase family 88 protein [uncultured Alistipes sp.]|jgi:predicted unsaturated glucuronyl hydrolase involved in regulation of bacterial surface properties, and related proteins|uniref:glycoside hydrolase family 88/105 protein n=1 Tax=uncultured Alistipes sp. TaxID=538949 RepID=UPI0025E27EEB|nr:glycoside hydrolase family 88 protein [uncultured Alistipes sp.]
MKKLLISAALGILCTGVSCASRNPLLDSGKPLAVRMVESEIARNPSPMTLDGIPAGKVKWNYTTGLELLSIMNAGRVYDRPDFYDYAARYFDTIVRPDASVLTYAKSKYNLDHICPGRALFEIYDRTHEERYKQVLDTLFEQLHEQPRNADGGFWHKQVYPHQMWLDGLYMAEPFYAEYVQHYVIHEERPAYYDDIANQFIVVAEHTYDPVTRLYRHAYDDSREMFWCDKTTGQSAHAWGRAMGWYAMAIVETLQYLSPEDTAGYTEMIKILNHIYEVLPRFADPKTGMWYQVLDEPTREGNYLESTGSIMFVYAMLKGVRLGYLPEKYAPEAQKLFEKFVDRFIREDADGTISMTDCCAVAGLGGKTMRSGTFEYYISEPVIDNDCKGIGPFIWASMEYDHARGKLRKL